MEWARLPRGRLRRPDASYGGRAWGGRRVARRRWAMRCSPLGARPPPRGPQKGPSGRRRAADGPDVVCWISAHYVFYDREEPGTHRSQLCPVQPAKQEQRPSLQLPRPEHSTRCWLPLRPTRLSGSCAGRDGPTACAAVSFHASFGSVFRIQGATPVWKSASELGYSARWSRRQRRVRYLEPHAIEQTQLRRITSMAWGARNLISTQLEASRAPLLGAVRAVVFPDWYSSGPKPTGHDESQAQPIIVFQSHTPVCSLQYGRPRTTTCPRKR